MWKYSGKRRMASLVQYVIVNKEIITKLGWPLGAVIAQCCHATTAVGHQFQEDVDVKTYFSDIDNMHKVVLEVTASVNCFSIFFPTNGLTLFCGK